VLELHFRAMGCQILVLLDTEEDDAADALQALPFQFDAWEAVLSRFRQDSELSRLNRDPRDHFTVSPVLWEVLSLSLHAAEQSSSLVTPTVLATLEALGYDAPYDIVQRRRDPVTAPRSSILTAVPVPDWRSIRLDPETRTVHRPPGMRLDLGGVAKGWAAQRAADLLARYGPVLVDVGGDIVVSGPRRDGTPWLIGVADPLHPDRDIAIVTLAAGAIATSGRDYRRWQRAGQQFHHLIDPRTGRPAVTDVLTATAIAPTGWEAEMAAKVVLLLGRQAGLQWIEEHAEYAALAVIESANPCLAVSRRARQLLADEPSLLECCDSTSSGGIEN